jgi:DNA-binding transcriptional LysR family regulator
MARPPAPSIQDRFLRNLDWNLLHTFHVIVQSGNLTRAAQKLGRKQPAVSLALRRLEGHLGAALCTRASNRFELTPEGMVVAHACEDLFQRVGGLPDRLANLPDEVIGHLRIAAITSITSRRYDRVIAAYHRKYPQVQIGVDIVPWEEVTRRLTRQLVDIGVAPARFLDADFAFNLLYAEPIRLYCGHSHACFGKTAATAEEIADEGLILTGGDEPDVISRYRLQYGLGRVVAGQSEHLEEAKRLTVQGVGLCFLPEPFAEPEVAQGLLWPVLPETERFTSDIYVISLPRERLQLPARLFLDLLQEFPADER